MSSSFPYHQGIAVVLRSSFWGLTKLLPKKSHPSHWWTDYQYWLFVNSSWLYWIDHWEIKFKHMWKYIAAHIWYGTDQIFYLKHQFLLFSGSSHSKGSNVVDVQNVGNQVCPKIIVPDQALYWQRLISPISCYQPWKYEIYQLGHMKKIGMTMSRINLIHMTTNMLTIHIQLRDLKSNIILHIFRGLTISELSFLCAGMNDPRCIINWSEQRLSFLTFLFSLF